MKRDLIILGVGIVLTTLGYIFHAGAMNLIGGFSIGWGGVGLLLGDNEE